jgi:hypothetical protein
MGIHVEPASALPYKVNDDADESGLEYGHKRIPLTIGKTLELNDATISLGKPVPVAHELRVKSKASFGLVTPVPEAATLA